MEFALLGFFTGLSLILAIGAQNIFVIEQGLKKQHVFIVCLICSLSDLILIFFGIFLFHYFNQYFNSLIEDYNGVYPFAIAAYNAGPNMVKTWRRVNGDPTKNQLSYIDWIELIRFKETRNYVQRVLENVNVYKYMISKEPVKIEEFFK